MRIGLLGSKTRELFSGFLFLFIFIRTRELDLAESIDLSFLPMQAVNVIFSQYTPSGQ